MPYNRLSTAKIAKAAGCHPNTVRLYEQIGFIAPVERSPKGYRLYTEVHLDQMRLARVGMGGTFPGLNIRNSILEVVRASAAQDYSRLLELAYHHLNVVREEHERAEAAVDFLHHWVLGQADLLDHSSGLLIGEVARRLDVTVDMLRNWERNHLLTVPRSPANRYRVYRAAEIGRVRVIRLLRQTGYSPMAILRMLLQLDQAAGDQPPSAADLRRALDTPRPDEDAFMAADHWLSTLAESEQRAVEMIELAEEMARKYAVAAIPGSQS